MGDNTSLKSPLQKTKMKKKTTPQEMETVTAWWTGIEESKKNEEKESINIMVKFSTKQEQYAIPSVPISLKEDLTVSGLNDVLCKFLEKASMVEDIPDFEFLIGGKMLTSSLGEHLRGLGMNTELVSEVEYFDRTPPPTPKDHFEHDDWVAAVMMHGEWLLTGCYDNTLQIWSVEGMKKGLGKKAHKLSIPAHQAPVKAVSWLDVKGDIKTFVSCSIDQRTMVWEWDSKNNSVECVWDCRGHTQSVECVAANCKSAFFATGSWDNTVKIWNGDPSVAAPVETENEPDSKKSKKRNLKLKTPTITLGGHSESVSGVNWLDDSTLVSCSWDHSLRLWDVEVGGMVSQINGNVSFFGLSYSQLNGTVLAGCADRHIRLYDPRSQSGSVVLNKFVSHTKWVPSVRWSPVNENLFVSGSFDNTIKVWDRRSSQASLYDLLGHTDKVLCVDWAKNNHIASGSADCTAQIYDT